MMNLNGISFVVMSLMLWPANLLAQIPPARLPNPVQKGPILTFYDMKPIFRNRCQICHNQHSGNDYYFFGLNEIREYREQMIDHLLSGHPDKGKFNRTPEGQKYIQWLSFGKEFDAGK